MGILMGPILSAGGPILCLLMDEARPNGRSAVRRGWRTIDTDMAGDEDDLAFLSDEPMLDDHEGGSHERVKRTAAPGVEALLAEFVARSRNLSGAEFDAEFDRFIDRLVERNVDVAPPGLRDALRATVRSYIENDPTLSSAVRELRAAAQRT